jgi:hypothetical protein
LVDDERLRKIKVRILPPPINRSWCNAITRSDGTGRQTRGYFGIKSGFVVEPLTAAKLFRFTVAFALLATPRSFLK